MNRRDVNFALGAAIASAAFQSKMALPKEIAGIRIVDSAIARQAVELAIEASAPYLFNHALRTYLFGALIGKAGNLKFDEELLFLASILHDLGLTERYMGDLPFEIQGAQAAKSFLTQHGVAPERAAVVWDGIAFHPAVVAPYRQPEVALVSAGAGADVAGSGLQLVPAALRKQVTDAAPRLNFKKAFVETCAAVVQRHPRGAGRSFMRDIAERHVAGYKAANICDAIDSSPFDE